MESKEGGGEINMSETYKERMSQLKYMKANKKAYLVNITEEEYQRRINLLKKGE